MFKKSSFNPLSFAGVNMNQVIVHLNLYLYELHTPTDSFMRDIEINKSCFVLIQSIVLVKLCVCVCVFFKIQPLTF